MFAPADVKAEISPGVFSETVHCSDSHEVLDARHRLKEEYHGCRIWITWESGNVEIEEDFL